MPKDPSSMNWNQLETRLNTLTNQPKLSPEDNNEIASIFDRQIELEKLGQCRCKDCQAVAKTVRCGCGGHYKLDTKLTGGSSGNKEYKLVCDECEDKRGRFSDESDSETETDSETDEEDDSETETETEGETETESESDE